MFIYNDVLGVLQDCTSPPDPICFCADGDKIHYSFGYSAYVGDLIVEIANLANDRERYCTLIIEALKAAHEDPDNLLNAAFTEAKKYVSPLLSYVVMCFLYESLSKKERFYEQEHLDFLVIDAFGAIISLCRDYISGGRVNPPTKNGLRIKGNIKVEESGKMNLEYVADSSEVIIGFHLLKMQELEIRPKRCKMCKKYFFPASRSDEIYCRNEYKDGRTCAEVAFEINSKEDPFYMAYRTAYKTVFARARRRATDKAHRDAVIAQWRETAKAKMEEFKANDDLAGFTVWLKENR